MKKPPTWAAFSLADPRGQRRTYPPALCVQQIAGPGRYYG